MRRPIYHLAILLLGTLSCAGHDLGPSDFLLPPGAPAPVMLDAAVYTLTRVPGGYDATAVASYTNQSGHRIYYRRCLPTSATPTFSLVQTAGTTIAPSVVGAPWACVGDVPTGTLAPHATIAVRVALGSSDSPEAEPPVQPDQRTGYFRVLLDLCMTPASNSSDCDPLPSSARESEVFELRLPNP